MLWVPTLFLMGSKCDFWVIWDDFFGKYCLLAIRPGVFFDEGVYLLSISLLS